MFKELGKIFLNQLKVKGFQVLLEALTSTMLEYNRKANSGDFDLRNQAPSNPQPTQGANTQPSNGVFGFLKNFK